MQDYLKIIEQEIKYLNYVIEPIELYSPIEYALSMGGKRLRPVFLLMATRLFSDNYKQSIQAALAIETFHNFTLLHDDVMDNSSLRRNKATVHKKWNTNIAILSGDTMMIKAYEHLSNYEAETFKSIFETFNKTAIEVCEGQQYDMNFETKDSVEISEYINMIRLKTAVLIAASFKIGSIIGGASESDADLMYEFGENIGIAFQLQDDFLDVYGDTKTFGKNIGGDIISNKKTYLLINALNIASGNIKEELTNLLNIEKINSQEKIKAVTNIYNKLNIKEITIEKIQYYFNKAMVILEKISVDKSAKKEIIEISETLMTRDK